MNTKKHSKANLENYSRLFTQLGLVLSLFVVYVLIQNKSYAKDFEDISGIERNFIDEQEQIVDINREQPKPEVKIVKKIIPEIIKKEDNDAEIDEFFFENIDPEAPVDITNLEDVKEAEEFDPNDEVDFVFLEEVPLYPGCKGTNEEKKACFANKIRKYINSKFNTDIASELGLSPGIQKIHTLFKIDQNGNVVDIQARAPHKKLQIEAVRVINLLPKMEPGKQQGRPVVVKYALPILFKIE
ncbi:energy transducer TonB [uncultured Lutibacter sp.]|uniref:energy transducer TonB n=1 Tax=Lutibacter sp. TaxID=1925666 RepID=UPI002622F2E2|nr:energy transducer TonB [uncultured Lutibacter sp.]